MSGRQAAWTANDQKHFERLDRRRMWLEDRIDSTDEDLSWDKAELASLTWAMKRINSGALAALEGAR